MFGRTEKQVLTVQGMTCGHCEQRVERAVGQLDGVKKAHANHKAGTLEIVCRKDQAPDDDLIRRTITELGYEVAPA